jgi:rhodanese-related sulfurtransferase
VREIQPIQLAAWLQAGERSNPAGQAPSPGLAAGRDEAPPLVLDVREPWEVALCRIEGSVHVPMREIPARLAQIDPQRPVVCVCHHGGRSTQVALFLEHHGVRETFNLTGGIDAWARQVDPSCPTY